MRFSAIGGAAWSGLVAAAIGLLLNDAAAQNRSPNGTHDVHLRIETAQAVVRDCHAIKVRLTIVNQSSKEQLIASAPPTALADLYVYDGSGEEVKATLPRAHPFWSGPGRRLAPGAELRLQWGGEEWLELRDWGYDLRAGGKYTITGEPVVGTMKRPPGADRPRSNTAEITIEQ